MKRFRKLVTLPENFSDIVKAQMELDRKNGTGKWRPSRLK
jgi:hypothetical protein